MSEKFLQRKDAPISEKVWQLIDHTVIAAAKTNLNARKLIPTLGPFGLGIKAVPSDDQIIDETISDDLKLTYNCWTPLVMIQSAFKLSIRDIAAYEQNGTPLNLYNVAKAAKHVAQQEDNIIFNGMDSIKINGLLNTQACQSMNLKSWDNIGAAAEDIMWAASMLDSQGCHGPYSLGLSVNHYNMLFRRYPQADTEYNHICQFIKDGIIKIPSISAGGILICCCCPCISICLGQDICTGFVGPSDGEYEFVISESVGLRLTQPKAICVLR
ncbi:MAG: Maritimacin [Planctomycetes bacterium ADurb.Bin401]|nr:MAG: Maritimacin [Planctomycetes bacterium ADurb.Bin401]